MKRRIEKRLGVIFGTFRVPSETFGYSTFIFRFGGPNKVTMEIGLLGRSAYLGRTPS
jgi:hypothetical protein